jgi:hypothetical protein
MLSNLEPRLAHLTRYPQEKHIHKAMMYYDVLFYGTEIIYIPRVDHKPVGPFPPNWARAGVIYITETHHGLFMDHGGRDRIVHVVEIITTFAFSAYPH